MLKHIITIIIALFTSVMTNTSFQIAEQKSYTADDYVKISEAEAPDYRSLYNSTVTASNKVSSKTTNFSALGKIVKYSTSVVYKGMWLENNQAINEADLPNSYQYTFDSSCYIIAPYDCTLESDSTTNDGHSMVLTTTVGSKTYRLTIANMDRWYMDIGRTAPTATNGVVIWEHTGANMKGWVFKQGNVLGVSTASATTINVDDITAGGNASSTIKNLYTSQ